MFGLFKKKDGLSNSFKDLLIKISLSLPKKFSFLHTQIEEGIIIGIKKQDKQYYKFILDSSLLNKYEDKRGRYFAINNIKINNINTSQSTLITLRIGYGIILGYIIQNESFVNLHANQTSIDISSIHIEFFDNNPIDKIFSKEELSYISRNDVYEVEINGCIYYHIQDIDSGDGDFIAIDSNKNIYRINHDPFQITPLSDSLLNILRK